MRRANEKKIKKKMSTHVAIKAAASSQKKRHSA